MASVYDTENFQGRVNLAASYIAARRSTTRSFDGCFEMNDGKAVATALLRRSEANPNGALAKNLFTYLREDRVREDASKLAHVPTRQLKTEAAKMRARARAKFEAFMAARA